MKSINKKLGLVAALASGLALNAMAAPDAVVTAAIAATQTAFSDNFSPIAVGFIAIVVVVTLVKMSVRWFQRAAK